MAHSVPIQKVIDIDYQIVMILGHKIKELLFKHHFIDHNK